MLLNYNFLEYHKMISMQRLKIKLAILFFLVGFSHVSYSQDIQLDSQDSSIVKMSPSEFDNWIEEELESLKKRPVKSVDQLAKIIQVRIVSGLYTTDDAIMKSVEAHAINEFYSANPDAVQSDNFVYQKTISFIEAIESILYKRDLLNMQLLSKKASLYLNRTAINEELDQKALNTYLSYWQQVEDLNITVDFLRNESALAIGNLYLRKLKDKSSADPYFIEVLKYPFYNLANANSFQGFRDMYIQAGLGRINSGRGNLKKLQELYFIPSTTPDLYPILKNYIEELGGSWDR